MIFNIDKLCVKKVLTPLDFQKVYALMEQRFPKAERFPLEKFLERVNAPHCMVLASFEPNQFEASGLSILWNLNLNGNALLFIEYLAIHPSLSNKGIGTAWLQKLLEESQKQHATIIIEIENGNEPEQVARRKFYTRQGFDLLPNPEKETYEMPAVMPNTLPTPMDLLASRPQAKSENLGITAKKIKDLLYKEIYHVPLK